MKKFIALALAITAISVMSCTAYAAARYSRIRYFDFDGEVTSSSVYGEADISLSSNYPSKTVITLERSTDGGSTFRKYRELKSKSSTSSSYSVSGEAGSLSSAYDYRLKAELFVYDSNGNEIEYDSAYIK